MRYSLAIFMAILSIIIFNPEKVRGGNNTEIPKYVGSEACEACHQKEYGSFIKYAKKSTSFESIQRVKKGLTEEEIKKCYFCHTTGYGKLGGFVSPEETPHLKNAGCEVCHGPGEIHVRTLRAQDIKMNLTMKDCEECHISERVKAFRYKPLIHGGAH
jgi:hypothetical protein